uniref:Uncharacterized protein n=1 Tax=Aegilops tauschii subsp. strangulata TaxID=200361 RepID=A0A453P1B0_AEGTS
VASNRIVSLRPAPFWVSTSLVRRIQIQLRFGFGLGRFGKGSVASARKNSATRRLEARGKESKREERGGEKIKGKRIRGRRLEPAAATARALQIRRKSSSLPRSPREKDASLRNPNLGFPAPQIQPPGP